LDNKQPFIFMDATLRQLQTAMDRGKITAKELVEMYLKRIDAYDRQGPAIRAMLALNPFSLEQAIELDEERKLRGSRGSLHGIPIVIKDNCNTKDMPTTGGTKVLESFVPADDSDIVKKLREAGAIILGKTNLHELALFGLTLSSLGGQTLNPYDLTKTPGGSSGGTGAAVSANFAAAGTGTDTVNSIRSPASANNLVGIRPTKGLVSLEGIIPVSSTQDNAGPIARTVEDAAILLEVMAGNGETYTKSLKLQGLLGTRIGLLRNLFGKEQIHEEVNRITELAITQMHALGAEIVEITVPELDSNQLLQNLDVQRYELKNELERYLSTYNAPVGTLGELIDAGNYESSVQIMLNVVRSLKNHADHPEYQERLIKIENLKKQLLQVMVENRLDVFLYPHQKRLVVDIGEESQIDRNGIVGALTGFPAITFQGGFSKLTVTAAIGIPVGIEFLGKPYHEAKLLAMAYAYEKAANHRRIPPMTPPLQ
jgi:amidase